MSWRKRGEAGQEAEKELIQMDAAVVFHSKPLLTGGGMNRLESPQNWKEKPAANNCNDFDNLC